MFYKPVKIGDFVLKKGKVIWGESHSKDSVLFELKTQVVQKELKPNWKPEDETKSNEFLSVQNNKTDWTSFQVCAWNQGYKTVYGKCTYKWRGKG